MQGDAPERDVTERPRRSPTLPRLVRCLVLLIGAAGAGWLLSACTVQSLGTMTVTPAVIPEQTPSQIAFTYTAPPSESDGQVQVVVPTLMTAPQTTSPGAPGYTSTTLGTCTSASIDSITHLGNWQVTLDVTCPASGTFTLDVGGPGASGAATIGQGTGTFNFPTFVKFGGATTFTQLASTPQVQIETLAGSETVTVSPDTLSVGGATATVTVLQLDRQGRPLPGMTPEIGVGGRQDDNEGSQILSPITDHGDGTYTATLRTGDFAGDVPVESEPIDDPISGGPTSGTAIVHILAGAPASVGFVGAGDLGPLVADGVSSETATFIVRDQYGNAIVGQSLTASADDGVTVGPISDNGDGTYSATMTAGTTVGDGTVTVQDGALTGTNTVELDPGPPADVTVVLAQPTVFLSPSGVGLNSTLATITVTDAEGHVTDALPVVTVTGGGAVDEIVHVDTGRYTTTISSGSVAGPATVTATVGAVTGSATLQQVLDTPTSIAITMTPSTVAADGQSTANVIATLKDASGDFVYDAPVTITTSGDASVSTVTDGSFGVYNTYNATITTSTTVGDQTITVADGDVTATTTLHQVAPSITWSPTGSMATARAEHTATLLPDGDVLVAGGVGPDGTPLASAELYHPDSGTWTTTGSMGAPRASHTATLLPDGDVLVTGGLSTGNVALSSAELYDPDSGTWTTTAPMSYARSGQTATLLPDGDVLVAGGSGPSTALVGTSTELYRPSTATWTPGPTMLVWRSHQAAILLGTGQVLMVGGGNGPVSGGPEEVDPADGRSFPVDNIYDPSAPSTPPAVSLDSGRVLLFGSVLFQPGGTVSTYPWTATATPPLEDLTSGTLVRLADGRVLAVGGYQSADTALYDPVSGVWTAEGAMGSLRSSDTATLLPDGSVLTVGGTNGSGALATAERSSVLDAARHISMATSPSIITADGISTSTITVTVTDTADQALAGEPLTMTLSGPGTLGPVTDNGDGTYTATITAATLAGDATVTATDGATTRQTVVHEVAGVAARLHLETSSNICASATDSIQAVVTDVNGNAIASDTVTLSISGSASLETPGVAGEPLPGFYTTYVRTCPSGGSSSVVTATDGILSDSVTLWNPGTWTTTTSMSAARAFATATVLANGRVLVAGGTGTSGPLASSVVFDPTTNTWSPRGALSTARSHATATLLPDGRVLVAGGTGSSGPLASAEIYNPVPGTWSTAAPMSTARTDQTATLLPNGRVLVVGGAGPSGPVASAEIYNPAANTWSTVASMSTARSDQAAALLPNGHVLVVAGTGSAGVLATTELYDPTANTWTAGPTLASARTSPTATVLADGQVAIAGGSNGSTTPTSSQLYDPATGTLETHGGTLSGGVAVLLPDQDVLVVGGTSGTGPLGSCGFFEGTDFDTANGPTGAVSAAGPTLPTPVYGSDLVLLQDGRALLIGGQTSSGPTSATAILGAAPHS